MKKHRVLGIMSGTSLDGLDLSLCDFWKDNSNWCFSIEKTETINYSREWKDKLWNAYSLNGLDLTKLDFEFGKYIGQQARKFLSADKKKTELISSHGQTVFHNPDNGFSLQIGNGAAIAAETRIKTVCNFRTLDVCLKGQGAPLVPIGDAMLFSEYDYCLNIGGFANISHNYYKKRIAYDICPANFAINHFCKKLGFDFDFDGKIGKSGSLNLNLLKQLNALPFYTVKPPKSLGREWVEANLLPVIDKANIAISDIIRTLYEHIAFQINKSIGFGGKHKVLVTGGGTHNTFLISLIKEKSNHIIIVPDTKIIDFKEAIIFAFLGLLRLREEKNCLASVTGANIDCCGGVVYLV